MEKMSLENKSNKSKQEESSEIINESSDKQAPGNEYTEKRKLVVEEISYESAIHRAVENTSDPYLKKLGGFLLANTSFIDDKKAYIAKLGMRNEFTKVTGGSGHGFSSGFESIDDPRIIIHEAIHTYTASLLTAANEALKDYELDFKNKVEGYFAFATQNAKEDHYGLSNTDEFLSELSNKQFLNFLDSIPYTNVSLPQITEDLIAIIKNPFIQDFEIVSEMQKHEDGDFFFETKFPSGATQNIYFKSEREAKAFFDKKNGVKDTNTLAFAVLNDFIKFTQEAEKE